MNSKRGVWVAWKAGDGKKEKELLQMLKILNRRQSRDIRKLMLWGLLYHLGYRGGLKPGLTDF